jgi:hypothetical protein
MWNGQVEPAGVEPALGRRVQVALPALGRRVQQDRGGHAHVQALDEAAHGHAYPRRTGQGELGVDALALVAEYDPDPRHAGQVVRRELAFRMGRDERGPGGSRPCDHRRRGHVTRHVDPLLGPASHRARHGERRTGPLDDVELLHPEGLAGSHDRGPVVRVVRPVEDDRDACEPPRDDLSEPGATGFGHERLEHPHERLGVVRFRSRHPRIDELVRAEHSGGRAPHRTAGYSRTGLVLAAPRIDARGRPAADLSIVERCRGVSLAAGHRVGAFHVRLVGLFGLEWAVRRPPG